MRVAVKSAQIFVNSQERVRPCSWARKTGRRNQSRLKKLPGQTPTAGTARSCDHRAECPQRPPLTVLGPAVFAPGSSERHKIPEPAGSWIEGMADESQI